MELLDAIKCTKNKKGMKVDFSGMMRHRTGGSWIRKEISDHFNLAREAWLKGGLETVADFFGLYV